MGVLRCNAGPHSTKEAVLDTTGSSVPGRLAMMNFPFSFVVLKQPIRRVNYECSTLQIVGERVRVTRCWYVLLLVLLLQAGPQLSLVFPYHSYPWWRGCLARAPPNHVASYGYC